MAMKNFICGSLEKKAILVLLVTTICVLSGGMTYIGGNQGNVVYASALEELDGIHFWKGDRNYPVYASGNQFGSALDLSSAYVVSDDGEELIIAVSEVSINYAEDRIVDVGRMTFKEDRQQGIAYYCHEESGICKRVKKEGSNDWMNDVYYYLKTVLEKN